MFGARIKIVVFDFNYIVLGLLSSNSNSCTRLKGWKDESNSLQLNNVGGDDGEKEGDMAMHQTNDISIFITVAMRARVHENELLVCIYL